MRIFILLVVLVSCVFSLNAQEVIFLKSESMAKKKLPFSKATQVGDLLFLSGELGTDPKTSKLAPGGIKAETKQMMMNVSKNLQQFNSSLDKVAKCTVFLADINEWGQFNEVYVSFFKDNFPARSAVAGSGLAMGARVEMECIAVVN